MNVVIASNGFHQAVIEIRDENEILHMELYAHNFLAILEENRLYRLSRNDCEILTNIKTIQA